MAKPAFEERAELVVWRDGSWRCELWIVNGMPRLRLFRNGGVVRDFAVAGAREALAVGEAWKSTVASYQPPAPY